MQNIKNKKLIILGGIIILTIFVFALPTFATQVYGIYPSQSAGGSSPPPSPPPPPPPSPPSAPVISNIFTDVSYNSAVVHWTTNVSADSAVAYGLTTAYTATTTISESVLTHAVALSGLAPTTVYRFRIATTGSGGTTYGVDQTFTTTVAPDITPPVISNLGVANIAPNTATVTFTTNEPATSVLNYVWSSGNATISILSPTTNHAYNLTGLVANTAYNVSVTAKDASNNQSAPSVISFQTLKDIVPPPNVTNFIATAGNAQNSLSWENPSVLDFAGVIIKRKTDGFPSSPTDGTTVYGGTGITAIDSGLTNGITYYYAAFAYDTSNNYSSGAVASASAGWRTPPPEIPPTVPPPGEVTPEIPPTPPGPTPPPQRAQEQPIFVPSGAAGVTPEHKLALADFEFWAADRTLRLAVANETVNILPAKILTIFLNPRVLTIPAKTIGLTLGARLPSPGLGGQGSNYLLNLDPSTQNYAVDFTVPSLPQTLNGAIVILYEDNRFDTIDFNLQISPLGQITSSADNSAIQSATVALFRLADGAWELWDAARYAQKNPTFTNVMGTYGLMVPNGTYYISAAKEKFLKYEMNRFTVTDNVINAQINLIALPPPLKEVIKSDAPLVENIKNVTINVAQKISFRTDVAAKAIADVIQNPFVEEINKTIAAPAITGIAIANTAAAVSVFNIWGFIQYLITQPLLLLQRKKRKGWGIIYNALTKLPIDLAIVRLLDAKTGRVVQTRVTDKQGRFVFFAPIGEFLIEATKREFQFPSAFLRAKREDEVFTDIYHGEALKVASASAALTPNIPLDPVEKRATRGKLILKQLFRGVQHGLSLGGLAMIIISLIISPSALIAGFAAIHSSLYFLFRRLSHAPAPKSWGIVYDEKSKTPLRFVIARIFETQFNKLLSTQVTDILGRYSFLVGKNIYYVTFEKPGYTNAKTPTIDLRKRKEGEVVALDIPLKPASVAVEISFGNTKLK